MLPTFAEDEQRAAVTLYRELAKGSPVSATQLAAALDVPVVSAEDLLGRDSIRSFVYPDEEGPGVGFRRSRCRTDVSQARSRRAHPVDVVRLGQPLHPEILGEQARIESRDPHTGGTIRLTVTPEGVRSQEPETIVVSFVAPDTELFNSSADNVMANFCHFVFFFESRESGEAWATKHEGAFLLALDEAADLARRLNARNWGGALTNSSLTDEVTPSMITDVAE